jgi:hypothetical protein
VRHETTSGTVTEDSGWFKYRGINMLRVVGVRDDDADQPPVLVVEDVAG